jgi:hypothetical protein
MAGNTINQQDFKKPRSIILQPRDEAILAMVCEFGLLFRKQLQRLLDFPCVTRINIRLKKLSDYGYISQRFLPSLKGNPMAHYFLGPRGVEIAAKALGKDPLLIKRERECLLEQKNLFLNHFLFINEFRLALTLALKDQPQMMLESWLKEKECSIEFSLPEGTEHILRPDGYFRLFSQWKRYDFFLEADCSTMSNARMKSKAKAYFDYSRPGLFEHDFGSQYFRVLVITKTQERLLNVKTAIEDVTKGIFYFTAQNQLNKNLILDRIWQHAGRQGFFSLLES